MAVQGFRTVLLKAMLAGGVGLAAAPAGAAEWREKFFAPDGHLDVSGLLAGGGFIPVPIIITEPAVDGGFGIAGQFIHQPDKPGAPAGRTIVGGAHTGNGSWGGGLLRQGALGDDRWLYRFGAGYADVTLPIYPFGGSTKIDYGDKMKFAFANVRYKFEDSPFSVGPRVIFRTSDVAIQTQGPLAERVNALAEKFIGDQEFVALGLSANYDTRDNPISPTQGVNAVLKFDVYSETFASDRDFTEGEFSLHVFQKLAEAWSIGGKLNVDTVSDDAPFSMAPQVDLRGVESGRYEGDTALNIETELRRQFTPRWAGVAFGGYGQTYVNDSRLFEPRSDIWTYGAGVRYRISSKFGIDVGLDVARGPEDTIVYIQFGHAWAQTMD